MSSEARKFQPGKCGGAVVHLDCGLVDVAAIRDHRAALARRDDLVELQAERSGVAEGAEAATLERGTHRLARVLDQREPVALRDVDERSHLGRVPAHVHRQESLRAWVQLALDVSRIEGQRLVDLRENR